MVAVGRGHQCGQETHCLPWVPCSLPTCEKVVAVLPQLLGLSIEAAGAAVGGRSQPLAQGLEALAALGSAEDYNGVVLHVVEALNCRGCHI